MNKFSLALAALLGFAVLTPATAEAGGCRTRITYDNCGSCLHWEYRCVGRAYDGCAIYRWVVVSRSYPRVNFSYGYGGSYRGGYSHYHGGHRHRGSHGHRH